MSGNSNQNIFSLKKKKKEKNKENKSKEESEDNNFSVEVVQMNYRENLDYVIQGMKIEEIEIESYEDYASKIGEILSNYKPSIHEIDYRLSKIGDFSPEMSAIEKMKIVGKVGEDSTIIDIDSANEDLELKQSKLRVEPIRSFTSVRANNCVFKGKWCYEVTLLTSKLAQIGWCQINTPFKQTEGIGDDHSSYAYDGYRVFKWNKLRARYGENWDIGDIVGVCIDLDERFIEFFQNGKSLGKAFENIPLGENIAYFPGISISRSEKVLFNFGSSKMAYTYLGYSPLDIPVSIYTNSKEITLEFLKIIKSYTLNMLGLKEIPNAYKLRISSPMFNFIANVSCNDMHTITNIILPFLVELSQDNLVLFFQNLFYFTENKCEFFGNLMDHLANHIEMLAITLRDNLSQWEDMIQLFMKILRNDSFTQLWIESRKCVDHLKLILSGNFLKIREISVFIKSILSEYSVTIDKENKTFRKLYMKVRNDYETGRDLAQKESYDKMLFYHFTQLICTFLNDTRIFRGKEKSYTLRSVLFDYYVKSVKESFSHSTGLFTFLSGGMCVPNDNFIKYFYFSLLEIFQRENEIVLCDLNKFSIEPWLSRDRRESLYYDEVGIGGTISHVTGEYGRFLDASLKEKKDTPTNFLLHRILNLTHSYILKILKDYIHDIDALYEKLTLKDLVENEDKHGSYIINLYRNYFNIFSLKNQNLLYGFGWFLINWILKLMTVHREIVYFIPKSIMLIPFEICKILVQIKSKFILDKENGGFRSDFCYPILSFYLTLFNDDTIANPELKELFIRKVSFFISKKKFIKFFEREELLEMLIKGLLKNMANEQMHHFASEIMVKIIKPTCFGEKRESFERNSLIKVTKKFFETNVEIFNDFMDNYNTLVNKIMTEYTGNLTESARGDLNNEDHQTLMMSFAKRTFSSFSFLCELLKIFEFLLGAYPNQFMDVNNLNFSRLSNFLKNLSSRILEKVYLDKLITLIDTFRPGRSIEIVKSLGYSTMGIFLNIESNKELTNYKDFIAKLVSQSDFDLEPLKNVGTVLVRESKINANDKVSEGFHKYNEIIDYLLSLKLSKVEKKMSEQEWEQTTKNEKICIICYSNENNRLLLPCRHGCCNVCLMQYLRDKNKCFICNASIEGIEEDNNQ